MMTVWNACIRFRDDIKKNEFVLTSEIKYDNTENSYIDPQHEDDYDAQHLYEILWCLCSTDQCQDKENKCQFYKGYIVCLASSYEKLEEKVNKTRVRIPKQIFSPSDTGSNSTIPQPSLDEESQTKQLNVNRNKMADTARNASSKMELQKYTKEKFLDNRKLVRPDEVVNEETFVLRNSGTRNQIIYSEDTDAEDNNIKEPRSKKRLFPKNKESEDVVQQTKNRPKIVQVEFLDPLLPETARNNSPHNLSDNDEDNSLAALLGEKPRYKKSRNAIYRERQQEIDEATEVLEDLYNTPEAREVDPAGKNKYNVENDEIYLGNGKAVSTQFWNFLKTRGDTVFLRETAQLLCGKRHLVNRCIKVNKTSVKLEGRSPRKILTPSKHKLIKEIYKDYLTEKGYNEDRKARLLGKVNRVLGYKIRDLRNSLYELNK